ncbi:Transposon En/Spm-like [Arabidopsis suecica]|uniref:Transposon En/Spm-like n=1 Tax=Arabidopsis suecica TaxID=45249 RepID=A0A8T2AHR3_ARASU|nr:Transposon En/Spm-like [Arabidopsis suecica]
MMWNNPSREWMYNRIDPYTSHVSEENFAGVEHFIDFASSHVEGRKDYNVVGEGTSSHHEPIGFDGENVYAGMDNDAFHGSVPYNEYNEPDQSGNDHVHEEPTQEAKRFYDMLASANTPLYDGCREGQSQLSLAARFMNQKVDHNLSETCMDGWAELFTEYLPEGNQSTGSYYETETLMRKLGLPYYTFDPVILTPYNLPPDICMNSEYLFLTILNLGPNHPRASLDVFLQPLIEELKELWQNGVEAYDVSCDQNFIRKAVFCGLLAISQHMACCRDGLHMEEYRAQFGKKHFMKGKNEVNEYPPQSLTSEQVLYERIKTLEPPKKSDCEGNGHENNVDGYGDWHNWHKESILWELPYWTDLNLRHNLDVMHIEKNVLDNVMYTMMNVKDKSKDTVKLRIDVSISYLEIECESKKKSLRKGQIRELLPRNVHLALSGIGAFFRDLSTRSLELNRVQLLNENIVMILCNLEKIFPPSFFDVMEHLPVHLPYDIRLESTKSY